MKIPNTILLGSIGPNVEQWQRIIGEKSDGIFGKRTQAATIAWQLAHGLTADGIVGARSWSVALQRDMPSKPGGFPFVQAKHYTPGPRRGPIDLIVFHTMEYPEKSDSAEWCAKYFATADRRASAHYAVDVDSVVQCVQDSDIAWHAPGANHNGIGIEHAGYARQTRGEWLDSYSRRMLEMSASLVAGLVRKYGIPATFVDDEDLKRGGARGITTHNCTSLAFEKGKGHFDPGPSWPSDVYLEMVNAALRA
jgi:hypothetical protein